MKRILMVLFILIVVGTAVSGLEMIPEELETAVLSGFAGGPFMGMEEIATNRGNGGLDVSLHKAETCYYLIVIQSDCLNRTSYKLFLKIEDQSDAEFLFRSMSGDTAPLYAFMKDYFDRVLEAVDFYSESISIGENSNSVQFSESARQKLIEALTVFIKESHRVDVPWIWYVSFRFEA